MLFVSRDPCLSFSFGLWPESINSIVGTPPWHGNDRKRSDVCQQPSTECVQRCVRTPTQTIGYLLWGIFLGCPILVTPVLHLAIFRNSIIQRKKINLFLIYYIRKRVNRIWILFFRIVKRCRIFVLFLSLFNPETELSLRISISNTLEKLWKNCSITVWCFLCSKM